jgi:hypothetical protein
MPCSRTLASKAPRRGGDLPRAGRALTAIDVDFWPRRGGASKALVEAEIFPELAEL